MNNKLQSNWQDWSIQSFRDVRRIANQTTKDSFVGVPVTGNALEHLHIVHGDLLIVKITSEIKEDKLCVWNTPDGRMPRFGYVEFGYITLCNQAEWSKTWTDAEVKLIGEVIRVERDL